MVLLRVVGALFRVCGVAVRTSAVVAVVPPLAGFWITAVDVDGANATTPAVVLYPRKKLPPPLTGSLSPTAPTISPPDRTGGVVKNTCDVVAPVVPRPGPRMTIWPPVLL